MASILVTTPDGQSYDFELNASQLSLGRGDDNAIVIPDGSVSTTHGQFADEGGVWVFTDLGSTNGTKINGQRVERVELGHGAQFEIGNCAVVFSESYEEAAPAPVSGFSAASTRRAPSSTGGYGEQAIDRGARLGFGARKKAPDGGRGALLGLGVVALLVALGVAVIFFTQGLGR
jgi:pSer/pThr/pTyr-binding forkhead associated (FHA) protein